MFDDKMDHSKNNLKKEFIFVAHLLQIKLLYLNNYFIFKKKLNKI